MKKLNVSHDLRKSLTGGKSSHPQQWYRARYLRPQLGTSLAKACMLRRGPSSLLVALCALFSDPCRSSPLPYRACISRRRSSIPLRSDHDLPRGLLPLAKLSYTVRCLLEVVERRAMSRKAVPIGKEVPRRRSCAVTLFRHCSVRTRPLQTGIPRSWMHKGR